MKYVIQEEDIMKGSPILICLCIVAVLSVASPLALSAPVPVYSIEATDVQWTQIGTTGVYTAPTWAEDYTTESWERPIEDDKWSDSDGTRTSNGKYYGYIDLVSSKYGVDDDYLYVSITVATDFVQEPGKNPDIKGLEGKYFFYFETAAVDQRFMLLIDSGKDLGSTFSTGSAKVYLDEEGTPVPGAGITVTYDDDNNEQNASFDNEASDYVLEARANGLEMEMALELSSVGLEKADFDEILWMYAAGGVSNPSSISLMFVNDHFSEAKGSGVEYDSLSLGDGIPIPEPATMSLLALGGLAMIRRKRRK